MPVPSASQLALTVVLVTDATAFAQPRSPLETGLRRIELHAVASAAEPEIHISPGSSTVLTFDVKPARQPTAPLLVELERSAAFTWMELGDSVLRLVPSEDSGWVLVEAETDEAVSPESWTLRLSGEGSGRVVVVDGIRFAPVVQKEERR